MSPEHLELLARLPLLLNSSLDVRQVINVALNCTRSALNAEAATVFVRELNSTELMLWALKGGGEEKLDGKKMPAGKGIVGWVIEHNESVLVPDAQKDKRFFQVIEREGGFVTRDLICAPLSARGGEVFGAVQILNKKEGVFVDDDLNFLNQLCHQVALAISNARLFESLQSRTNLLESLDRKKDDMISVIVHEFQTPLNVVLTSADLIASGVINNQAVLKRMSETLIHGVSRLSKIVAEVKNVSLVSGGKISPKKAKFDIRASLDVMIEFFTPIIEQRKLKLVTELPPHNTFVMGDESLILVVLKNIISNAIRFTPDEGTITVSAKIGTGMVRCTIADTGIGIEKNQMSAIFEKFYEVTPALFHSSGEFEFKSCGIGLGLAAAKAIAIAHGTSIDINSTLGKGSAFSFHLPLVTGV